MKLTSFQDRSGGIVEFLIRISTHKCRILSVSSPVDDSEGGRLCLVVLPKQLTNRDIIGQKDVERKDIRFECNEEEE